MDISEAQSHVRNIIRRYGIKKSPLASLVGVLEELGELSSTLLVKEGFKVKPCSELEIDYTLAEVLFELLKLAEDCNVDLEKAFAKALEKWNMEKPRWI